MNSSKITKNNFRPTTDEIQPVFADKFNALYEDVSDIDTDLTTAEADIVALEEKTEYLNDAIAEVTTTVVLTAADSGKVYFNNSDSGASTFTLPAPAPGLRFKWIWTANKTTATIIKTADVTDSTGDMLRGGLLVCAAAAVNTFVEASGDVNTMTFDDDVVNGAAGIGSWVEAICTEDPTWCVTGVINSTTDADGVGSAIFSDTDA